MPSGKKIAIVYDWIDKWGGVERVLLTLHDMFPKADFYTSYFDFQKAAWAKNLNVKTSFVNSLPSVIRTSRVLSLPFYPFAFETLDLSAYDLVISITSTFAKSVVTKPGSRHICYLLTPTRFLWITPDLYLNNMQQTLLSPLINHLKSWDKVVANRPDKIISISRTVADRCRQYYQRESEVIYPPFDIEYWGSIKNVMPERSDRMMLTDKFYLVVSRLEPYKKVDLVLRCFKKLKWPLVVVGMGTQEDNLKKMAGENITFLKGLSDKELGWLYSHAEALIMPQNEDFGYVALEAQFFGCPVIAYRKGGSSETITDGQTGLFFDEQTDSSLIKILERFHTMSYNLKSATRATGLKNIEKFSRIEFEKKFVQVINSKVKS